LCFFVYKRLACHSEQVGFAFSSDTILGHRHQWTLAPDKAGFAFGKNTIFPTKLAPCSFGANGHPKRMPTLKITGAVYMTPVFVYKHL